MLELQWKFTFHSLSELHKLYVMLLLQLLNTHVVLLSEVDDVLLRFLVFLVIVEVLLVLDLVTLTDLCEVQFLHSPFVVLLF